MNAIWAIYGDNQADDTTNSHIAMRISTILRTNALLV